MLARLGGDEFAVVVPGRLAAPSSRPWRAHHRGGRVNPYEIDGHRDPLERQHRHRRRSARRQRRRRLLMAADLALYARQGERSRVPTSSTRRRMNRRLNDRRELEMDLREALDRNELELHYQPIIDLQRNVVTGFEALARWRHPVEGMVPPAAFIPVAEDSGLILPLGEWALREACRQGAQWPERSQGRRQPIAGAVSRRPTCRAWSKRSGRNGAARRTGWSSRSPSACSWRTAKNAVDPAQ